jgi:hypothetical protein
MSTRSDRLVARVIRASTIVDRAARRFDQARSALVTRFAPGSVLDAYNDLAYERTPVYRAGAPQFRETLFNWEAEAIAEAFPPSPGRVLIGGAGGGREAFALAARGYDVVAFEPSAVLARSMVDHAPAGVHVEALVGRYEDLPALTNAATGAPVDVRQLGPFDASIFGWASFSHLRTPAARAAALRAVADLTHGPVLLSFYARRPRVTRSRGLVHVLAQALGLRFTGDLFTPVVGFYHLSDRDELEAEVRAAGLEIVKESLDERDGCWPYVVVRRASPEGQNPVASMRQDPIFHRSGESLRT